MTDQSLVLFSSCFVRIDFVELAVGRASQEYEADLALGGDLFNLRHSSYKINHAIRYRNNQSSKVTTLYLKNSSIAACPVELPKPLFLKPPWGRPAS